jgi:hypothetical protein
MVKAKSIGFALPAVLGILALTSLACAAVWRMQWVHQQLLNVQFHLIRNQQIGDGVLPLVVQDIVGSATMPDADGQTNLRHFAGTDAQTHAFFPNTPTERDKLQTRLGTSMCQAGICAPRTITELNADQWQNLLDQSQAVISANLPSSAVSAFYWVEVWLNTSATEFSSAPVPPSPFIYRITVLVRETPSTGAMTPSRPQQNSVVIQAVWSRATLTALSGKWHSWKLLS